MHPRMIRAIFSKDLWDAIRDARVLVAILVPLGLGLLYGQLFQDEPPKPSATVAYAGAGQSGLLDALRAAGGEQVELNVQEKASEAEVRQAVQDKKADIGLVVPAGFDAAVQQGQSPPLTVIRRQSTNFGENFVAAALDGALRQMAGQHPPATIQPEVISQEASTAQAIFEQLGLRRYFVLAVVVMLIAMIAMLAVPVILAEEAEKKTLDALTLIASYADVIAGKALVGLVYIVVSVGLLLATTGLVPSGMPEFLAGAALLSVTLTGFGLLVGGVFRNANQLNTWSGIILLPVIAPAFVIGLGLPRALEVVLDVLPTSQAMKLMVNGLAGQALFADTWLSYLVLLAWTVIAYGALLFSLSRRQA